MAWKNGVAEPETCTIAGTSSSTIASYTGYQLRSVRGGELQCPPLGSGLRLQPMNPSSSTQRRSSATDPSTGAPGDCGSCATPMNRSGNRVVTRWTRSLHRRAHSRLTASSPRWWAMADARGEKTVRSMPRWSISGSWLVSMVSRISSSLIVG